MFSHGELGTVRRAEVGVEKEIDSSVVSIYVAETPRKVEEIASWWPLEGMTAFATYNPRLAINDFYAVHISETSRCEQHERFRNNRREMRDYEGKLKRITRLAADLPHTQRGRLSQESAGSVTRWMDTSDG